MDARKELQLYVATVDVECYLQLVSYPTPISADMLHVISAIVVTHHDLACLYMLFLRRILI